MHHDNVSTPMYPHRSAASFQTIKIALVQSMQSQITILEAIWCSNEAKFQKLLQGFKGNGKKSSSPSHCHTSIKSKDIPISPPFLGYLQPLQ